jgi:hypothetical protein
MLTLSLASALQMQQSAAEVRDQAADKAAELKDKAAGKAGEVRHTCHLHAVSGMLSHLST